MIILMCFACLDAVILDLQLHCIIATATGSAGLDLKQREIYLFLILVHSLCVFDCLSVIKEEVIYLVVIRSIWYKLFM